ncbi:hypothetical protein SMNI109538_08785 [Smaragdicoccus niigatensis]
MLIIPTDETSLTASIPVGRSAWWFGSAFGMLEDMNIEVRTQSSDLAALDLLAAELERVAQKIVIGALAQTVIMARKIANTVSDGAFGIIQQMTADTDTVDFELIAKIEAKVAETGTPLQDWIGDAAMGMLRTATAPLALNSSSRRK